MISHQKGSWGEERAVEYLREQGYRILKRNFRKAFGEVDIIAVRDRKIVFFEVKNWKPDYLEDLRLSINDRKIHRFCSVAESFLLENPAYEAFDVGFDLILLSGRMEELDHIENFI